jgi:23S rRNA (cytosine1962-C5)-methyltransferase
VSLPGAATIQITPDAAQSVGAGHPWIYRDALRHAPALLTGDVVDVFSGTAFVGRGIFDAGSALAVRVWTRRDDESIGPSLVRDRVSVASAARQLAIHGPTTGFRLIHGEADGLPGVVCDVYAPLAVLQLDTPSVRALAHTVAGAIMESVPTVHGVVLQERGSNTTTNKPATRSAPLAGHPTDSGSRSSGTSTGVRIRGAANLDATGGRVGRHSLQLLAGTAPELPVIFSENGLLFETDPSEGHKTGFYLDQRPNRALVRELAAGARVLNLFSYTGGFSVAAAAGGAYEVISVDAAEPVLEVAKRNFRLNEIEPAGYRFVTADVFEYLTDQRARFELVICDPPSMARSAAARGSALEAYTRLNKSALTCVAPNSLLLTASCSSHVREEDLVRVVARGARAAGREIRILSFLGAGPDHPVLPAFPEGRTLNGLLVFVH